MFIIYYYVFSFMLNACIDLITCCLILWFECSLKNTFKLRDRIEQLMSFVSRNKTRFASHLLILILKASYLTNLIQGIDSLIEGFRLFSSNGLRVRYFCELMIIIGF